MACSKACCVVSYMVRFDLGLWIWDGAFSEIRRGFNRKSVESSVGVEEMAGIGVCCCLNYRSVDLAEWEEEQTNFLRIVM